MTTRVGATSYSAPSSGGTTTSRTITMPTGLADGDLLILLLSKAGSATGFTITGLSFTKLDDNSFTGHWSSVYWKVASASDSGATVTITTASSYRVAAVAVAYRGVTGIQAYTKQNGNTSTAITCPAATPTGQVVRLDWAGSSGGTDGPVTYTAAAGMTKVAEGVDGASSGGGYANGAAFENLTPTSAAVASKSYSASSAVGTTNTGWTLLLAESTATQTAVPTTLEANTGSWTNEGGAASIPAALADSSDATFAKSPTAPTGAEMEVKFGWLADGLVTVTYDADVDSGTGSLTATLKQGATTIASWTDDLTTTKTTFTHTTSAGEAAAITNRADLRVVFSATAS